MFATNMQRSNSELLDRQDQIKELQQTTANLRKTIEKNKAFLYMVIHDLKHPTEAIISQLKSLETQVENSNRIFKNILQNVESIKQNLVSGKVFSPRRNQSQFIQNQEDDSSIEQQISESMCQKIPQFIANTSKLNLDSNKQAREDRQQRLGKLQSELQQFVGTQLQNLGFLVDGNEHSLSFTIKYSDFQMITKVSHNNQEIQPIKNSQKENYQRVNEPIYQITKMLAQSEIENKNQSSNIKFMIYSSQIMRNLMMDLLDLAQVENNKFKLNKEFFSIQDVIDQAFTVLNHVAEKSKVQLVRIPNSTEDNVYYQRIYGDPNRFMQVIINFLSNALKFSQKDQKILVGLKMIQVHNQDQSGNIRQYIESMPLEQRENFDSLFVENSKHEDQSSEYKSEILNSEQELLRSQSNMNLMHEDGTCYIKFELSIQDFGCGIPPDKLKTLFINFNNLDEHKQQNPQGRGLGLSICKLIVEQMGGQVHVTSKVGHGSTFSLILKAMCKLSQNSPKEQELIKPCKQITQPKRYKLLLVNDEPFLLFSYKTILQQYFEVYTAVNGIQAVQIVSNNTPDFFDAIILDINMPIMDGLEAVVLIDNHIRTNSGKKTFVYALTADCNPKIQNLIKQSPFDCRFETLSIEKEIKKIFIDIQSLKQSDNEEKNKMFPANSIASFGVEKRQDEPIKFQSSNQNSIDGFGEDSLLQFDEI